MIKFTYKNAKYMSVLSKLYRYRFPFVLLGLWIIIVLLVNEASACSHLSAVYKAVTYQENLIQKTIYNLDSQEVHKTVLKNGLTILTKEVHTAPVVAVQVWYKAGSENEQPGQNGVAHQLEHMMFKGTKSRPITFDKLFSILGSDSNAFTSYEQTAYYNTAQANKLKALLVLEADRMQNALIDANQLKHEQRVVISELQGYENHSDYRLNSAVMRAVFPHEPYSLPVGGDKTDIQKLQTEQVRKFYSTFYNPDNAVLVIVGDFETTKTLKAAEEIFGKIPKVTKNTSRSRRWSATSNSSLITLHQQGAAGLLQTVYPLPNINHPDVPALDVMDYILAEGSNSHLYRALVESGLATDVVGSITNLQQAGWYKILVTGSPNQDLKKIDLVLTKAIANLAEKGVTPLEVNRAKAQLQSVVILGDRDITSIAMQLGYDYTATGDYQFTDRYLAAIRQVTAQDVQRVANKYLQPKVRTLGFFEPTQTQTTVGGGSKTHSRVTTENFSSGAIEYSSELAKYLPPVDLTTSSFSYTLPEQFVLNNGLRVLLLPDKTTPTVTLKGYIKAGTEFDPDNKAGLASLVADNLMNGTKTNDAVTITRILEEHGINLDFQAYREGLEIHGYSLSNDLSLLVNTLSNIVKNTTFNPKKFEFSRQQALAELRQELDDPKQVAKRIFVQSVYPKKHPLHSFPTQESLELISRQDVIDFKAKYYRPDTTVLVLVGDFFPSQMRQLIEAKFRDWQVVGQPPTLEYPVVSMPESVVRLNPVVPGKAEAITYMGNTAINRKDARFYAASVLNQILGGDTLSSRLGAEVRDRLGLTYGIYSFFQVGKKAGTFLIEMQTSAKDALPAIASTRKLLEEIHTLGVTAQEVEAAKRSLMGNYIVSLANPDELAEQILMNEVYGLNKEELHSFTDKIQAVSLNQVNQAARELLHPNKIIVVTAGPAVLN